MNRRRFSRCMIGSLAGGFCAGIGASPFGAHIRNGILRESPPPGKFCLTHTHESLLRVGAHSPGQLTLAGSRLPKVAFLDEMASTMDEALRQDLTVLGGGCDDAVLAVRARLAHIGNLCCPVPGSPAEGMDWLPVARDIKVVVTHADNPVDDVSFGQLVDIARGRIRNWKLLRGSDRPIALVVHEHCPTYFEPVRELLLGGVSPWAGHRLSATTDEDHLRQVARFSASLGINSWVLAEPQVRHGELKALKVDGYLPTVENVAAGNYPLHGPFNMIFTHWNEPMMRPFLDLVYSESGRRIIERMAVPVPRDEAIESGRPGRYAAHI